MASISQRATVRQWTGLYERGVARAAVTLHNGNGGELSGGEKLFTTLPQTSDPQLSFFESKI